MSYAFRLHKGMDLRQSIEAYVKEQGIQAAAIAACVGCVTRWRIRCADGRTIFEGAENAEIISLNGTVSLHGCHLHIALAREDMSVFGGHLMDGCVINTTAEVVLLPINDTKFVRREDVSTGYKELAIEDL